MFSSDFLLNILLLISGLFIAFFSSILGIGGGVFTVPLLYFAGENTIEQSHLGLMSIAGSLAMSFLFSLSATIKNIKNGMVCFESTFFIIPGAIVGSFAATFLTTRIDSNDLLKTFAIVLFLGSLNGFYKLLNKSLATKPEKQIPVTCKKTTSFDQSTMKKILALAGGLLTGLLSSFTGIGGGIIIIPVLLSVIKLPAHNTVATSTFCIVFITLIGSLSYYYQSFNWPMTTQEHVIGYLYIPLIVPLIIGGVLGGYLGSIFTRKIPVFHLNIALLLLQFIIALKILIF